MRRRTIAIPKLRNPAAQPSRRRRGTGPSAKLEIIARGAHPWRHRRRLWRHRHQCPVRRQGSLQLRPRSVHHGQRLRHPVHLLLDAHRDRLDQVRGAGAARRQQRRGRADRHAGPGIAGREGQARAAPDIAGGGDLRHFAFLWRRRDHAGDLRAVRRRGPGGGVAGIQGMGDSADAGGAVLPLHRAKARHGRHRQVLRAHHAGVVR